MRTVTDWPGGRKVAALVTVALELWSPGHWPAYAPMAAAWPLSGIDDTHSTSWANYGVTTGIWRLLDVLGDLPATVGVNGLVAERHPETVVAVHEARLPLHAPSVRDGGDPPHDLARERRMPPAYGMSARPVTSRSPSGARTASTRTSPAASLPARPPRDCCGPCGVP